MFCRRWRAVREGLITGIQTVPWAILDRRIIVDFVLTGRPQGPETLSWKLLFGRRNFRIFYGPAIGGRGRHHPVKAVTAVTIQLGAETLREIEDTFETRCAEVPLH